MTAVGSVGELGMLALIDDAKRASALAEVRSGRMYDLGHVLDERVPVFPGRYFKQTLVTTAGAGRGWRAAVRADPHPSKVAGGDRGVDVSDRSRVRTRRRRP
jgi:hypothetical protein